MGSAIVSVLGVLLGTLLGYKLSNISEKKRTKNHLYSYYCEIEIIQKDYGKLLESLLGEYRKSKRTTCSVPPEVDFKYIHEFEITLAGEITIEHRKFIKWLKGAVSCIDEHYESRKEHSNDTENFYCLPSDFTALLIVDVIQIIYCTTKLLDSKEKFSIETNHDLSQFAEVSCKVSNIVFDRNEFEKIIESGGKKA